MRARPSGLVFMGGSFKCKKAPQKRGSMSEIVMDAANAKHRSAELEPSQGRLSEN